MSAHTNASVEKFDRLIDWDTSLTQRDEFLDRVFDDTPLRIKYGADITAPTLHLGHAVNLRVMREMQGLGHKVVFLLGGFTTLIGDPTDRLQARDVTDLEDMAENEKAFVEQIKSVIEFDDPDLLEIRNNTEWWGGLDSEGTITNLDLFRLLGDVTLSHLLSRKMFKERQRQGQPIMMSEFLYPVLQGYDSVQMQSDVTVVGSDQLFNESMGREMQKQAGQTPQMIVCTKITPGLDGGPKQSKSIGNYVGIGHGPEEMFSRLMLLRDDLVVEWMNVYSDFTLEEIAELAEKHADDPVGFKLELARNVTNSFHGEDRTEQAEGEFKRLFKGESPIEATEINVSNEDTLRDVLIKMGYKSGNIKQFLQDGSVKIISNEGFETSITDEILRDKVENGLTFKVGKRKYFKTTF